MKMKLRVSERKQLYSIIVMKESVKFEITLNWEKGFKLQILRKSSHIHLEFYLHKQRFLD